MGVQTLRWQRVSFLLLIFVLSFAPLFRAANRPLPLMVLELFALGLLLLLAWQPGRMNRLPGGLWLYGGALLLIPLLHLLPLPVSLWEAVPGREPYAEALALVAGEQGSGWSSLSIIPGRSEAALYETLPLVAVFAAVYLLPVEQVQRLVYVFLAVAGCQAALGLMQYGAGPDSPLYFGNPYASRSAAGTYANRDHLAGLLELAFPVALGLFAATLGQGGRRKSRRRNWRHRLEFLSSVKGHQAAIYGALTVLLLLGLVFTRSRAGAALAMVGLFLSMLAYVRRLGGSNVYGTLGTVAAVAVVLAAEIGLAPVLDRFARDPLQDARWAIFSSSLEGIGRFFPFGSGVGTYPNLYPMFQPVELGTHFVNNAHNDFIESVFEGGVLSLLLILFGLILYLRQWVRVWISGRWGVFRFIQVGAGIGLCLMLLHSLVDFNMRIPANALFAAFLAAVFFKEYQEEHKSRGRSRSQPKTAPAPVPAQQVENAEASSIAPAAPPTGAIQPEWEEQDNPFMK